MQPLALLPTDAISIQGRQHGCTHVQACSTWHSRSNHVRHSRSIMSGLVHQAQLPASTAPPSAGRVPSWQGPDSAKLNTAHGCKAPDCWAVQVSAALIVVLTRGGSTARLVAKYRPSIPVRASMAWSRVFLAASTSCTAAATCSCAAGGCSRLRVPGVGYLGSLERPPHPSLCTQAIPGGSHMPNCLMSDQFRCTVHQTPILSCRGVSRAAVTEQQPCCPGAHGGSAGTDHGQPHLVLLGGSSGPAVLGHTRPAAHAVRRLSPRHRRGHHRRHPAGTGPLLAEHLQRSLLSSIANAGHGHVTRPGARECSL